MKMNHLRKKNRDNADSQPEKPFPAFTIKRPPMNNNKEMTTAAVPAAATGSVVAIATTAATAVESSDLDALDILELEGNLPPISSILLPSTPYAASPIRVQATAQTKDLAAEKETVHEKIIRELRLEVQDLKNKLLLEQTQQNNKQTEIVQLMETIEQLRNMIRSSEMRLETIATELSNRIALEEKQNKELETDQANIKRKEEAREKNIQRLNLRLKNKSDSERRLTQELANMTTDHSQVLREQEMKNQKDRVKLQNKFESLSIEIKFCQEKISSMNGEIVRYKEANRKQKEEINQLKQEIELVKAREAAANIRADHNMNEKERIQQDRKKLSEQLINEKATCAQLAGKRRLKKLQKHQLINYPQQNKSTQTALVEPQYSQQKQQKEEQKQQLEQQKQPQKQQAEGIAQQALQQNQQNQTLIFTKKKLDPNAAPFPSPAVASQAYYPPAYSTSGYYPYPNPHANPHTINMQQNGARQQYQYYYVPHSSHRQMNEPSNQIPAITANGIHYQYANYRQHISHPPQPINYHPIQGENYIRHSS